MFFKAPFHYGKEITFQKESVFYNCESEYAEIPIIKGFQSKKYVNDGADDQWISLETAGRSLTLSQEDVFLTKTRIGITKKRQDRNDENKDGFYKIDTFRLNRGFSFAFFLTLSDGASLNETSEVFLGAERSLFKMDLTPAGNDYMGKINSLSIASPGELCFISDAFVSEETLDLCRFAWVNTVPFRNITTNTKRSGDASLDIANEKSKRFHLVSRGSVLFFSEEKEQDVLKLINNNYLQSFGYNIIYHQ